MRRLVIHNHFPKRTRDVAPHMINNLAQKLFEASPQYKEKRPNYTSWGYAPMSVRKEFSEEAARQLRAKEGQEAKP